LLSRVGFGILPVTGCLLFLAAVTLSPMRANDCLRFLVGQREAIQRVASSSAAIWTGLFLVLLTAIARNYDQTLIGENPLMWLFGPLLFSIVSGTWIYAMVYGVFARMAEPISSGWSRWRSFMGLFWMTAPIAWLYAIPVERIFDSFTAAQANILLLAVVSLWRVILMARVVQMTTSARFPMALVWVLFAAAVEVLVVSFFGGLFAQAIMRGMGGMRNSPEEELIYRAMSLVFNAAFIGAPVLLVIGFIWKPKGQLTQLPRIEATKLHWKPLTVAALFWIGVAIVPQRELINNVAVEKLISAGNVRKALDYLSTTAQDEFSPGRPLPPKAFERSIFDQLPACFEVLRPDDAPWVRMHLMRRLREMTTHYGPRWRSRRGDPPRTREQQIQDVTDGLQWHGPDPGNLLKLIDGLAKFPEGREWSRTNSVFLEGIARAAANPSENGRYPISDWLIVSNGLNNLSSTNQNFGSSNSVPVTNSKAQAK